MSLFAAFRMPDPDTLTPLRAIHSLREAHVTQLCRMLPGFSSRWSLDRHEGCDGDLTVILMPNGADDVGFALSRSSIGYNLAMTMGDVYQMLGTFGSLSDVARAVRARLSLLETTGKIA